MQQHQLFKLIRKVGTFLRHAATEIIFRQDCVRYVIRIYALPKQLTIKSNTANSYSTVVDAVVTLDTTNKF